MSSSHEETTSSSTIDVEQSGAEPLDFIRTIVADDAVSGRYGGRVVTRFPPEPNGFLHIGHAKSICLNFGVAEEFGGVCNLRFDDTNPETEDIRYVHAIQRDIRWLGFEWGDRLFFASDYFEQLYDYAVKLIEAGKAYVDSLNDEEIRAYRGTVTEPGRESPYRNRSVAENLDLFRRMRAGEFPDGAHVLRAKIDMAAANMKLRDPLLYRIRHASHYRTGDAWCIYPMYDYAHPLSDAIEGVTHSICTLEFENNRDIYDWLMDNTQTPPRPHQYEFARLNLDYTVMSKRKLLQLVEEGHVQGWDDPRMPTIAGMRRRGVTPQAIRTFADKIGVARANSRVDISLFEHCIRDDLNFSAPRVMAVLRPLKLVILNHPEDQIEHLEASYWPRDVPKEGSRTVPFGRELLIEQDDFMLEPPADFYRLAPGREVRLRFAYIVKCVDVVKDPVSGEVVEVHCTYDPETKGGVAAKGRRVQGTIHWVSAQHSRPAEVRLYDRLFSVQNPDEVEEGHTFKENLNPNSMTVITGARVEPSIAKDAPGTRYQFERLGYFVSDMEDSRADGLVFNRIIELRDSWTAKISKAPAVQAAPKPAPEPSQEAAKQNGEARRSKTDIRNERRAARPELAARLARYTGELGLSFEEADVLSGDLELAEFFEEALSVHANATSVATWIGNEVLREAKESPIATLPIRGRQVGALAALVDSNRITQAIAKEVFAEMMRSGEDPETIVHTRGLDPITDAAELQPVLDAILAANPDKVAAVRGGKSGLQGFFVGQVMRQTNNRADAKLVQNLVAKTFQSD